ncbi:hypothetical protein IKW73_03080 [Candidatus Saccharibacteria bacterium]|nr:hypothetical protein [Candidatus Saccharibacteria bacterium]
MKHNVVAKIEEKARHSVLFSNSDERDAVLETIINPLLSRSDVICDTWEAFRFEVVFCLVEGDKKEYYLINYIGNPRDEQTDIDSVDINSFYEQKEWLEVYFDFNSIRSRPTPSAYVGQGFIKFKLIFGPQGEYKKAKYDYMKYAGQIIQEALEASPKFFNVTVDKKHR